MRVLCIEKLAELLMCYGGCSTLEEADVLADVILSDILIDETDTVDEANSDYVANSVQEYLDISESEAIQLVVDLQQALRPRNDDDDDDDDYDEIAEDTTTENDDDEELEGDESSIPLFDGECELCDRFIKLTRHHLIPKSTWPRIQTKLLHAVEAIERGDTDRASHLLGFGLVYLMEPLTRIAKQSNKINKKASLRLILHQTSDICRQCHSTVHNTHDNLELALNYSTVEKLLEDDRIAKFCKWASKQRPGKYSVS